MALKLRYFSNKPDSPILYEIDADTIQSFAEANLDRELTPKELERVHYSLLQNEEVSYYIMVAIITAAEDAINTKDNDWSRVDEDYEKRETVYELNSYPIGL